MDKNPNFPNMPNLEDTNPRSKTRPKEIILLYMDQRVGQALF